jgi:hypothetical protein
MRSLEVVPNDNVVALRDERLDFNLEVRERCEIQLNRASRR